MAHFFTFFTQLSVHTPYNYVCIACVRVYVFAWLCKGVLEYMWRPHVNILNFFSTLVFVTGSLTGYGTHQFG